MQERRQGQGSNHTGGSHTRYRDLREQGSHDADRDNQIAQLTIERDDLRTRHAGLSAHSDRLTDLVDDVNTKRAELQAEFDGSTAGYVRDSQLQAETISKLRRELRESEESCKKATDRMAEMAKEGKRARQRVTRAQVRAMDLEAELKVAKEREKCMQQELAQLRTGSQEGEGADGDIIRSGIRTEWAFPPEMISGVMNVEEWSAKRIRDGVVDEDEDARPSRRVKIEVEGEGQGEGVHQGQGEGPGKGVGQGQGPGEGVDQGEAQGQGVDQGQGEDRGQGEDQSESASQEDHQARAQTEEEGENISPG